MPALQGFEVRTFALSNGELDILHAPGDAASLWTPASQIAMLAGIGLRADGIHSLSDLAQAMDRSYVQRVSDPHRFYSQTRSRSTTLFAVEGMVQKLGRTATAAYAMLCREIFDLVLPHYPTFITHNAELVVCAKAALEYFEVTGRGPEKSLFRDAIAARDKRLAATPKPPPEATQPVDQPLVGVPALCGDLPCPTYGTYESPQWIGLYICDGLGIVDHHDALSRVPAEDQGRVIAPTLNNSGGHTRKTQEYVTVKEPGLYRLISESRKPEAEKFKGWLFREVLPKIRLEGYYRLPGVSVPSAQAGPTTEEIREALRTLIREELAKQPHVDQAALLNRLDILAALARDQNALVQQTIDLTTPSHQLFLPAGDYIAMDGVAEALKRAPKLAEPSFGLDHCPDAGKAALWMKRLCRDEEKKVAANAVARIIAKDAGQEEPPLYIPRFLMRRIEREHAEVLMYTPPCWAKLEQTFLVAGTPTLLFPGPRLAEPGEVEEA